MVWHDIDLRSYLQGQSHSTHKHKIYGRAITPYCHIKSVHYFSQLLAILQRCVMTFAQCLISKVKVTVHIDIKSLSMSGLFTAMLDLDKISHNCCPRPKGESFIQTLAFQELHGF